jgi:ubiquinone/menaquinone biosynthesis C-methylase UbiE
MGLYSRYFLPVAIEWACRSENLREQREKVIPLATGNVLEIGIGSGLNLLYYDGSKVERITAIDPLDKLWARKRINLSELDFEVDYIKGSADQIPAENGTFNTVVTTYTLCSINHLDVALREIHRVLKPGGKLIFSEHGKAPEKGFVRWQNLVNPAWKRVSGGCNLNRDIPAILKRNGFKVDNLNSDYLSGWKLTSYNYWGSASRI